MRLTALRRLCYLLFACLSLFTFTAQAQSDDAAVVFSTYLGGSAQDDAQAVVVDSQGFIYVAGATQAADFPIKDALQPIYGGGFQDGFVSKFSPTGELVWSTFLGGSGNEYLFGMAVGEDDSLYLVGETTSANFPVVNPFRGVISGGSDIFITRLNSSGTAILYSTYFGSSGWEIALDIALGPNGEMTFIGLTRATDYPVLNETQLNSGGDDYDIVISSLNPAGTALLWSTYLGGNFDDMGFDVAVDGNGYTYVTGLTHSADFPTVNAYAPVFNNNQPCDPGSVFLCNDAFAARYAPNGSHVYVTFLGGNSSDEGYGIAVDEVGNAYITGQTSSDDFPLQSPYQSTLEGYTGAFVSRLSPQGTDLLYSTYLDGEKDEVGQDITLDGYGNMIVMGLTTSGDFPTVEPVQAIFGGGQSKLDIFVSRFNEDGSDLTFSTYWGGSGNEGSDYSNGLFVDDLSNMYVAGRTSSPDFPTVNPIQDELLINPAPNGYTADGFLLKIATQQTELSLAVTSAPEMAFAGEALSYSITAQNEGQAAAEDVTLTLTLPAGVTFVSAESASGTCGAPISGIVACTLSDLANGESAIVVLTVIPAAEGTITLTSEVSSAIFDPDLDNNSLTTPVYILPTTRAGGSPRRNFYTTPTPTLSWNHLSYAVRYEIQVDESDRFTSPVSYESSDLSVQVDALADGVYFWRVRGCEINACRAWNTAERFVVVAESGG